MVFFSVLVSGVGLAGFALLALGFFQRELRRNLERDLAGILVQAAPVLLRIADPARPALDDWMAARLEGRLEEFGAVYAARREDGAPWRFGGGWPETDPARLAGIVARLPESRLPAAGQRRERLPGRGPGGGRENEPPPLSPREVRVFRPQAFSGDWLVAGARDGGAVVLLAVRGSLHQPQTRRLLAVLMVAGPLALLLVGAGAFVLAGRAVAPVGRLTREASSITAADLSKRIDPAGMEREFSELIEVFNGMLARLELSFRQARRFGQDAAHELNTPLTILTARVDEAVADSADGSPQQVRLAEIGEEVRRLREIVRKLHLLARIDGGGFRAEAAEIDPGEVVAECMEEAAELFPELAFRMEEPVGARARADRGLLRQILLNLFSNAGRYNRRGGSVRAGVSGGPEGAVLVWVENTGPAIPAELAERIFDRFARGDSARGREGGGLGLGLSLAREFARTMGGDLRLANFGEDRIRFELLLPGTDAGLTP